MELKLQICNHHIDTTAVYMRPCQGKYRQVTWPKSSDSTYNEIVTRDNLPRPNCDSDGKADNKRQAFIITDTRRFKIQTGDMPPPPLLAGPPIINSIFEATMK